MVRVVDTSPPDGLVDALASAPRRDLGTSTSKRRFRGHRRRGEGYAREIPLGGERVKELLVLGVVVERLIIKRGAMLMIAQRVLSLGRVDWR